MDSHWIRITISQPFRDCWSPVPNQANWAGILFGCFLELTIGLTFLHITDLREPGYPSRRLAPKILVRRVPGSSLCYVNRLYRCGAHELFLSFRSYVMGRVATYLYPFGDVRFDRRKSFFVTRYAIDSLILSIVNRGHRIDCLDLRTRITQERSFKSFQMPNPIMFVRAMALVAYGWISDHGSSTHGSGCLEIWSIQ
jgi:hypothetical protein